MSFNRTRCAHCRAKFAPERPSQIVHAECAADYAIAKREKVEREEAKRARAAAKVDRAETKRRRRAMRPIREFVAETQAVFNAWVRARDEGLPCISCGVLNPPALGPGGAWDAGHFLSRGAHPEKRFMEDNVHRQCKSCNAGSAKNPAKALTVSQNYAAELIRRIGPERYAKVLEPAPLVKLDRDQLTALCDHYRKLLKETSA